MNIKKFGKGLLVMTLATTMALSTPMAAFAQGTEVSVEDKTWEGLVDEMVEYLSDATKVDLATDMNKLISKDEKSRMENLYKLLKDNDETKEALGKIEETYGFTFEGLKSTATELAREIAGEKDVVAKDFEADRIKSVLKNNKVIIEDILKDKGIGQEQLTKLLAKVNQTRRSVYVLEARILSYDYESGKFEIKDEEEKLNELIKIVNNAADIDDLVSEEMVKNLLDEFNSKEISDNVKEDIVKIAREYRLLVKDPDIGGGTAPGEDEDIDEDDTDTDTPDDDSSSGDSTGGSTGGGGGGGSSTVDPSEDISSSLEDLVKEDANVDEITETILKDIEKLNPKQAKESADAIVSNMMDVIKKADPANAKKATDSTVKLVEALASRVTTQKAEVKDGKASLSSSKAKEQIKDAQEIIEKLTKASKDSGIQLTKTIKPTLNFEVDKDIKDLAVEVPADLWNEINGQANISVKTKGVELVLEHNTFKEKTYTINVKEDNGVVELTTDANFARPIKVVFSADKVTSYPSVYQIVDGDNKLVGGVYNPETKTIAATLKHFSFYTVNASFPQVFNDIQNLTWERKAIDELSARGYLAGMPGNLYAPHESTTRAEFATMLTRVMPVEETTMSAITFTDLKKDAWYYKSIATAVNQGWLVGRDNNKFDPSAPVTRQEVAAVLSRVLVEKGYLETSDDVKAINVATWAKNSVALLLREIDVKQISELDMSSPATRAEVAVMIYETLNK